MKSRNSNLRFYAAAVIAWCAFSVPASAQFQQLFFPVKFVCGFQEGTVPRLGSSSQGLPYEGFKPGNYATTVNVINLDGADRNFEFIISIEGRGFSFPPGTGNLSTLGSSRIGCPEIAAAVNQFTTPPVNGELFEGFLVVAAFTSAVQVQAVYTFESKNDAAAAGRGLGSSIDVESIQGFDIANRPAAVSFFQRLLKERDAQVKKR